jgi:outer membrane protein OmpA-like peptidoglycan-associated protein
MRKHTIFVATVLFFMLFLFGCATVNYKYAPQEMREMDQAIAEAKAYGAEKKCPNDYKEVVRMQQEVYETYYSCRTFDAIQMALAVTDKAMTLCGRKGWVLEGVHFDFNKWEIKSQFVPILKNVLSVAKNNPELEFRLEGHCDIIGTEKYNQWLSEKRASVVKDYLVNKGIDEKRLSTKGFGFHKPIAGNDTEQGRARNRRVEIKRVP